MKGLATAVALAEKLLRKRVTLDSIGNVNWRMSSATFAWDGDGENRVGWIGRVTCTIGADLGGKGGGTLWIVTGLAC